MITEPHEAQECQNSSFFSERVPNGKQRECALSRDG